MASKAGRAECPQESGAILPPMLTAIALALTLSVSSVQAVPAAPQVPSTVSECVAASRDFRARRAKELAPAGQVTADISRQISREWSAFVSACAAQFDVARAADKDLPALASLNMDATRPEQARAAIDRALALEGLSPAERAEVLLQAVVVGLREPKSDARNARLEAFVDELDGLPPAVFDQKFTAHNRMNGYYRGDDIDAGIVKHSSWIMKAAAAFSAEDRRKYGQSVVGAITNLAQVHAGQGRNEEALALLRSGVKEWGDVARGKETFESEIQRYSLVGTAGAPITAPRWLNTAPGTTSLDLKGKVTLLEFTAHWCGPCRESYPGIIRLRDRFGRRGFQVVLATQLWGRFGTETLAADTELERDEAYFAEHHLDVPIAIGDYVNVKVEDGRVVYVPARDPNDVAYKVGGIPQIQLLDRQGRIRLIMVGYDEANEEKMAKVIEKLLGEK